MPPVVLTVVTTAQLCSACLISEQAVREIIRRLEADWKELVVKWEVYDDPREAMARAGLEMPAFPALFYGDEQLTAGTIPTRGELEGWLKGRTPS